jgi:hypothetical protein
VADALLIVLALVSVKYPLPALAAAAALVTGLLIHLQGLARRSES